MNSLVTLLHFTADFMLQSTWMAVNKFKRWSAAIAHGVAYTAPFLIVTRDPIKLSIIVVSHTLIDHYRIPSVWPRILNWDWQSWKWYGWRDFRSYNPSCQPSYFSDNLKWIDIVIDQIWHLWLLYWLFR